MGEVVRTLEGGFNLVRCVAEPKEQFCPIRDRCSAHTPWMKVKQEMAALLERYTLADFMTSRPARELGIRNKESGKSAAQPLIHNS